MNMYLLDCTLRDGGYINDWEFGHNSILSIYERLSSSNVDIVEVGFIDDRRPFDINRSIFPDTESIREIYGMAYQRPPMVVGMIDYGTCDISNVEECQDSFIDGIRVIFKKGKMYEAMDFCRQLKGKGYKVFSQLVSITSYSDDELLELVRLVNDVEPFAVSMVDTYGLLHPTDLLHYYDILEHNVNQKIGIGFHAHNNLQLAYANALTFISRAKSYSDKGSTRNIVVDGTLYGMGKSAGNAPLELLAPYLNKNYGKDYHISPMLEAIEESVKEVYIQKPWDYKTVFYLSAQNRCHPSYVSYYENKGNLSVSKIDELLRKIEPEEKKLLYDKDLAEKLYQEYVADSIVDQKSKKILEESLCGRKILILGPGKNIKLQSKKVQDYIGTYHPIVISINYVSQDFSSDYVFVTKLSRYKQMAGMLHKLKESNKDIKIICTSNVETMDNEGISFDREPLLEKREDIIDNSFLMLLKILDMVGVNDIALAGLDGYSDKEDNYYEPSMEYGFVKSVARHLNTHIHDVIFNVYSHISFEFVTYSHYMNEFDPESASF